MKLVSRNPLSLLIIFTAQIFVGCAAYRTPILSISSETDLNAIEPKKNYSEIKADYSVVKTIKFGQDPEHLKWRFDLAKRNINFAAPERRIEFKVTLWDLPLIKTYLDTQDFQYGSTIEHELRAQMMLDHRQYTQFLIGIDSYINEYFKWSDWNIWMEDKFGRSYFPVKTKESAEVETMEESQTQVLGRKTVVPKHKIYHNYGTLYFKRVNLAELSPIKIVLLDQEELRRVEVPMKIIGNPPDFPPMEEKKTVPVPVAPEPEPVMTEEEKRKQMRYHFGEATRLYKEEKFEEAIKEWEKVLELDPEHKLSKIKIEKAAQFVEEPAPEVPEFSDKQKKRQMQVHFLLATELYRDGEYEAAIKEWEEVLKIDPNHEPSLQKIDKARQKLGDL